MLTDLLDKAKAASANAYAPYSGFNVGAALLAVDGRTFLGCNVENASYSLTICAERNALFHAVSEGVREFEAVAVYVDSDNDFPPCGACRQVLSEFGPSLAVIYGNRNGYKVSDLKTLLPGAFSLRK
jgi:cytidine deaminase